MYQVQIGSNAQWLDYEEMIDHLDLVIQYEKERKARLHGTGGRNHGRAPEKIDIEGSEEDQEEEIASDVNFPRKEVKSLLFI